MNARMLGGAGWAMRANLLAFLLLLTGCYSLPMSKDYMGPPPRPPEIEQYYNRGASYRDFNTQVIGEKENYTIKRYTLISHLLPITVDHYERYEKSDRLVLVFPVLGGKNIIADYFARYFARHGYDTAVVHRNNSFKSPENFDRLEEIFREDAIRDRIVLDFFEKEIGKKEFGSFGISRGGINVGVTAGIDGRLKHNVITLGGTDIVQLFRSSSQGRLGKYTDTVMQQKNISYDEFFRLLNERIKTDPRNLSKYMDARHTLMILGLFDTTVPFRYGQQLKAQIGNPETVYLMSDHFVGLLYTQFLRLLPPFRDHCIFPMDYVETEALDFYNRSFATNPKGAKSALFKMIQAPFTTAGRIFHWLFVSEQDPDKRLS